MITAEYLVTHCRYWDGTSDYYDRLMNMAEEYINLIDEPTISGFEIKEQSFYFVRKIHIEVLLCNYSTIASYEVNPESRNQLSGFTSLIISFIHFTTSLILWNGLFLFYSSKIGCFKKVISIFVIC